MDHPGKPRRRRRCRSPEPGHRRVPLRRVPPAACPLRPRRRARNLRWRLVRTRPGRCREAPRPRSQGNNAEYREPAARSSRWLTGSSDHRSSWCRGRTRARALITCSLNPAVSTARPPACQDLSRAVRIFVICNQLAHNRVGLPVRTVDDAECHLTSDIRAFVRHGFRYLKPGGEPDPQRSFCSASPAPSACLSSLACWPFYRTCRRAATSFCPPAEKSHCEWPASDV
jgi:hypothetical protein